MECRPASGCLRQGVYIYVWLGHCPVPRYQHFLASGVSSNLQTRPPGWSVLPGSRLPLVGCQPFSRQDRACALEIYLLAVGSWHLDRADGRARSVVTHIEIIIRPQLVLFSVCDLHTVTLVYSELCDMLEM